MVSLQWAPIGHAMDPARLCDSHQGKKELELALPVGVPLRNSKRVIHGFQESVDSYVLVGL